MKNFSFFLGAVLFVASCSSPLDQPYKQDSLEGDMIKLKEKLSEEDFATLARYIVLKNMSDDPMLGKTYGGLLEEAKEIQVERQQQEVVEKELAEKAKAAEAERVRRLGDALTVSVFDKGYAELNYQDYITYKFAFENKADRDIRAFSGRLTFYDLFNKEIKIINLTYDEGIPAHSTVNWSATSDYNQFLDKDVALKNKDLDNLKVKWVPEKIIFLDGESLE